MITFTEEHKFWRWGTNQWWPGHASYVVTEQFWFSAAVVIKEATPDTAAQSARTHTRVNAKGLLRVCFCKFL